MEELKTQPEETVEEPNLGFLDKIKIHKWKILGGVLGISVLAGAVFGAYKLGQRQAQPVPQPTPTPVATPTPDLTADWKVFKNEEYGFEFKYPDRLRIEENKYQGEQGYAYCLNFKKNLSVKFFSVQNVYAGAAGCYFEDFGIGGISTDFEAGRSGGFTDTRGYRKEDDRIIFKFAGTKEYEIPQELVKQVFTNSNQVKIVVVEGESYEDSPFPVMGTPGDGYLGALINTKHPYLTGLAIVYSKTTSLLSEEEFNLMLSTLKFL